MSAPTVENLKSLGEAPTVAGSKSKQDWDTFSAASRDLVASVKKAEIQELKSLAKPPARVKLVTEALMIILGEKTDWYSTQRVLNRPDLLQEIQTFDPNRITPDILAKLQPYITAPELQPENIKSASLVVRGICIWVHAVNDFGKAQK
uniref:Dynein heavy chain coiled coil stalk domain-containing protein n=1 Tax=Chromera velia CCMP2878 TaxID=1169474 RepID=A0A0G4H0M7_9ALVE|eukprot:Cvel_5518.t1-p1 / transcript=Cvel_5518.t1 / gene=Cvel_5518 / organism=Chromera_velia_CCMP2878 / gene_product=Dynein heavy chain 6, axonemal, putative / transcript_product=Dynein heavy chain 6, axonemal, putative / location=Cvel_scaffold258:76212-76652(+) / protein_length=147 / sequence_SO=supercontig / SO=protein_coding / is_pseudo=false